jgi:hypothetical protein
MKHLYLQILCLFLFSTAFCQENATISGYLTEESSGEPIIGGQILAPTIQKGALTNEYGFYSLTLPKGTYQLIYRGGGLPNDTITVDLTENIVKNIELGKSIQIEEVEINGKKGDNVNSTKIGQIELDIDLIKKLPAFLGEVDVLKTIQLLPGVSSVSEGGQGFYVRGGGPDQNLVLLDNAQVYNASHLFGFFSVFNSDAIKSVNIIKGSMPASYGGRLSSVLEVNMNEGNNKKFKVTGGLGLISSRLTLEGPIVKNKGSFIVSARRTYIDVFMKAFIKKSSSFYGSSYFFYDLNAKLNYRLGPKDKIYLSGYYGKDLFNFGNKNASFNVRMPWGNGIGALRWNHQFSSKLFMNTTATLTDYLFSFGSEQDQFKFELKSGIRDLGGKVELSYFPNNRHSIKMGGDYIYHTFTPTSVSASQEDVVFDTGLAQQLFSHESGIYAQDEVDITPWMRVNAGIRVSMYQFTGPFTRYYKSPTGHVDSTKTYRKGEIIKSFFGFEPRLSARFLLKDKSSIKAGFTYNNQYVHLASLSAVSLPTDIWYPSTDKAHPQRGWQASLGYFRNFNNNKWETSVEVYYKKMNNVIEFKQGALPSDNVNDNTDNLLVYGTGWSYGAEFFIKRTFGKITGWVGYTLAKSDRYFPDIQATKYPAKYDRRHDLTIVGTYELNKHWTFGLSFIYASGNTLTLPNSWYFNNQDLLFNYGPRNSTRMAPYHRLDISATWYDKPTKTKIDKKTGEKAEILKKFRQNVVFSVYNVYNRANPYFLYIDNSGSVTSNDFKISVKQVSLFPILPSITWNFEF